MLERNTPNIKKRNGEDWCDGKYLFLNGEKCCESAQFWESCFRGKLIEKFGGQIKFENFSKKFIGTKIFGGEQHLKNFSKN